MLTRKIQILVIGHNENGCTPEAEKIAYETGTEIAKSGAVLVTGGLGALCALHVMEQKMRGD